MAFRPFLQYLGKNGFEAWSLHGVLLYSLFAQVDGNRTNWTRVETRDHGAFIN